MIKSQMLWSKREERASSKPTSLENEKYIIEKSKQNRNRIILLLTITIYSFLAVLGTTDKDIFLLNPIQMPLTKISLPLIAFYVVIPLFILALHFNTLYMFNNDRKFIEKASDKLPLSIFDKGHKNHILNWIISFFIYFVPLITLFTFFIRFSDYQSLGWTAYHVIIIMFDIVLIGSFKKYFTYTIGILILSVSMLFWINMYSFIVEKPYINMKISELFPNLELTNRNLNKTIDLSLLNAYAKEENIEHSLALLTPVDMRGRNFLYADFSYSKMYRFDFTNSNISHAKFNDAQLPYSIFHNVTAVNADFTGAILSSSDIREMNAHNSWFGNVNLTQSHMSNSNFTDAHLERIDFTGSYINANFTNARLDNSSFMCTNVSGNFQDANLKYADFSSSEIGLISFKGAFLADTKFTGAIIGGLDVRAAFFYNTNFAGVVFSFEKGKGTKIIKKYPSGRSTGYTTPLQERVNMETNLTKLFDTFESKKKYLFNCDHSNLPYTNQIKEYGFSNFDICKDAIGKNSNEWVEFNKNRIITGKLTQEMIDNIIKKVKNNAKALENIYYDKDNKVKD